MTVSFGNNVVVGVVVVVGGLLVRSGVVNANVNNVLCESNVGDIFGSQVLDASDWPTLNNGMINDRDDGISVFVGGNFVVKKGAEIEGLSVTLEDFTVNGNSGMSNIGVVGVGSGIVPSDGHVNMVVGGDLRLNKVVQFMHNGSGDVLVGGVLTGNPGKFPAYTKGTVTQNAIASGALDLDNYKQMFVDLQKKSKYWATLPSNGVWTHKNMWDTFLFKAGDDQDIQVFDIPASRLVFDYGVNMKFDASLTGKTILINVNADNNGNAILKNVAKMISPNGQSDHYFDPKVTKNILWNIHDATKVELGGYGTGVGEFIGTVIIPTPGSETIFSVPGHSGRFLANGNVLQDKGGSEFHNYPFHPDVNLPNPPDPDNFCGATDDDDDDNLIGASTIPTPQPTLSPQVTTPTPTPSHHVDEEGCAIEMQKRFLENGTIEWTTIKKCRKNCDCPPSFQ